MQYMQKRPIDTKKHSGPFSEAMPQTLQTLPLGSMRHHLLSLGGLLVLAQHGSLLLLSTLHLPLTSSLRLVPLGVHLLLQAELTGLLSLSSVNLHSVLTGV